MTAVVLAPVARDERRGVIMMLVGTALFSLVNALVKELSETFAITQIIAFRNVFALIPILAFAALRGGFRTLRTRRPAGQALQAALFLAAVYGAFESYRLMPITDATAISFAQPLIVAALAAPLLGERIGPRLWTAVIAGFCGVLLMATPTGAGFNIGALWAGGAALASALALLQMRFLSRDEPSIAILFWTMALSGGAAALTAPFGWTAPTAAQAATLVALGVACGMLQYLTTRAVYHASAAAVAPTRYTMILWAAVIDIVWFRDWPTTQVMAGAAVVIVASSLVLRR